MSNKTLSLTPLLHDYLRSVSLREAPILKSLREETATLSSHVMQIAPEQGQFMALLIKLMGAKRILEVGVYTGYSSLVMALALPNEGHCVACDINPQTSAIAQRYWNAAGVASKIDFRLGPALATLDQLLAENQANSFDFVFIDADKANYPHYYERALALVRQGGLIVIDNVLWSGEVANPQNVEPSTKAIRAFNAMLATDDRIHISLLPLADGLTLAYKR